MPQLRSGDSQATENFSSSTPAAVTLLSEATTSPTQFRSGGNGGGVGGHPAVISYRPPAATDIAGHAGSNGLRHQQHHHGGGGARNGSAIAIHSWSSMDHVTPAVASSAPSVKPSVSSSALAAISTSWKSATSDGEDGGGADGGGRAGGPLGRQICATLTSTVPDDAAKEGLRQVLINSNLLGWKSIFKRKISTAPATEIIVSVVYFRKRSLKRGSSLRSSLRPKRRKSTLTGGSVGPGEAGRRRRFGWPLCMAVTVKNFRTFCQHTSLHGWQYIAQGRDESPASVAKHCFWGLIVTMSIVIAMLFLYNNTMDFLNATVGRKDIWGDIT